MNELILSFKDVIIQFLDIIIILFTTPLVTLGMVFILGRMLGIFMQNKPRNIIAIFLIYAIHFAYTYFPLITTFVSAVEVIDYTSMLHRLWIVFIRGSASVAIYVLIFWRLYDRFDNLLDKKFGDDRKSSIPKEKLKRIRKK